MLSTKYSKLLRAALSSKLSLQTNHPVPQLVQLSLKVKAEYSFDPINNVCLLAALTGGNPQLLMINLKKGVLTPRVTLTQKFLATFMNNEFPIILKRSLDKVVAVSYAAHSNKLSFTLKASDALSPEARKLWKAFETEVGVFEVEVTFTTNTFNVLANETLLRSLQIPVRIHN